MNGRRRKGCAFLLCLLLLAGMALPAMAEDEATAIAVDTMQALLEGDYASAEAVFGPELMQAVESGGGMAPVMESLVSAYGAFVEMGEPAVGEYQGYTTVVIPLVYEAGQVNGTFSIDGEGVVGGLVLQPQAVVEEAVLPDGVMEEEITVDAGTGYPVGATLCLPKDAAEPLAAVLLISGSGNNGRDEIAGANRVFAQLAHGLAQRGIATLRFDKRTYTQPQLWDEPGFTVEDEYVEDVLAALEILAADPRMDAARLYIAGHSQGGMLAPRFVAEGAEVAGLMLMAGSPRDLSDILYSQQMNVLDTMREVSSAETERELQAQYDAWYAQTQALYEMSEAEALAHPALYDGAFPAYYLYDMHQYDALELLASQQTPVLIMQGENDMQVYVDADYGRYQEALAGEPFARFALYEGLNHLFMPSEAADLSGAIAEYNQPSSIPEQVLEDMAAFVLEAK